GAPIPVGLWFCSALLKNQRITHPTATRSSRLSPSTAAAPSSCHFHPEDPCETFAEASCARDPVDSNHLYHPSSTPRTDGDD
ncbi:unnamed protein product, partial [Ectocarpus fasciculatus]